jgi:hypothetical protein
VGPSRVYCDQFQYYVGHVFYALEQLDPDAVFARSFYLLPLKPESALRTPGRPTEPKNFWITPSGYPRYDRDI